jgi:hypothetical protein
MVNIRKKIIRTKDIKENVIEIVIICRLVLEEVSKKVLMQQKFMRKDKRKIDGQKIKIISD